MLGGNYCGDIYPAQNYNLPLIYTATITDTITLSDQDSESMVYNPTLADGIRLSDSETNNFTPGAKTKGGWGYPYRLPDLVCKDIAKRVYEDMCILQGNGKKKAKTKKDKKQEAKERKKEKEKQKEREKKGRQVKKNADRKRRTGTKEGLSKEEEEVKNTISTVRVLLTIATVAGVLTTVVIYIQKNAKGKK